MERRTARSLAFDLLDTKLADHAQLTRLVVDHTLAPLRAACGLAAPVAGEDLVGVLGEPSPGLFVQDGAYRGWRVRPTPDVFDPVFRAQLLFGWLFPECVPAADRAPQIFEQLGQHVLMSTDWLLMRTYDEVADLVAGLLALPTDPALAGVRRPAPGQPVIEHIANPPHVPATNPPAVAELVAAQALVRTALDLRPAAEPAVELLELGLDQMQWWPAWLVDRALHNSVRQRLVWFGHLELEMATDEHGWNLSTGAIVGAGRGVFAASVPETLTGLVLLDFTEQLGSGEGKAGKCAACGRRFVLNAWQRRRVSRGEPVYHKDCHRAHRQAAIRALHRAAYVPRAKRGAKP